MSSYPKRCEFYVGSYKIAVDTSKWDCHREPAHCHVYSNGRRIGQVWLDSNTFATTPSEMSHTEINDVLSQISMRRYELREAYEYNRENGSD